jgi:opacity protein-like surface antigen
MKSYLIAATAALFLAGNAMAADGMSKDAYKDAKNKIEAQAKSDKKACADMKDNAKDVCQAEAKAKEKIAKAELDAQNHPGARADEKVRKMKAEGEYEVAKEKCEDQKGAAAASCKKDAKMAYEKAKADAKQAKAGDEKKKS